MEIERYKDGEEVGLNWKRDVEKIGGGGEFELAQRRSGDVEKRGGVALGERCRGRGDSI